MKAFPHIILASKSPRRKNLLMEANIAFEIFHIDVDEDYPESIIPEHVAEYLAIKKAEACAEVLKPDQILLTADSVVILNNKIYGKPKDQADAEQILTELSGNTHLVITGVCLKSLTKQISFSDTTKVTFDQLSKEEIDFYINNFKPFDKAGSYGIQDWIGVCKIIAIEGSYTNVLGLPTQLVYKYLQEF